MISLLTTCSTLVIASAAVAAMPESITRAEQSVQYQKAYSLQEIPSDDPQATDVIVKYQYDEKQKQFIPHYFKVTLFAEYDTTNGKDVAGTGNRYFAWVKDDKGNFVFKEVSSGAESDISVKYQNVYGNSSSANGEEQYYKWDYDETTKELTLVDTTTRDDADIIHYGASEDRLNGNYPSTVSGDFVGQSSSSEKGGAILNKGGNIESITGSFIANSSTTGSASGGAIRNESADGSDPHIGSITGNFIGNYATFADSKTENVYGGAIGSNAGTIDQINGNFIGNYVLGNKQEAHGGAIRNMNQTIGGIEGDFIANYAHNMFQSDVDDNLKSISASGGAIHNYSAATTEEGVNVSEITNIKGNFIGNYVTSAHKATGGAIYNQAGDLKDTGTNKTYGRSVIGSIIGNFIGNYAMATNSGQFGEASGGAMRNFGGEIGNIEGDFIGNYAMGSKNVYGGAIRNNQNENQQLGVIDEITGSFIGNYVSGQFSTHGGAIVNTSKIGKIYGDFIGNYATGFYNIVGGAIRNNTTANTEDGTAHISLIKGDFIGNYALSTDAPTDVSNRSGVYGGAINNEGAVIDKLEGNFERNYAVSQKDEAQGGAIYNISNDKVVAEIGEIDGNFIGNYATGETLGQGGAIYNTSKIGTISGSFIDNHASTQGGAIYTTTSLDIAANGKDIEFSGNYVGSESGEKNYQAIYVDYVAANEPITEDAEEVDGVEELSEVENTDITDLPTLTLAAQNKGSITFNDKIEGSEYGYNLHLTGDKTGKIVLNNEVNNANVVLDTVTLKIGTTETSVSNVFANSTLTVNSGLVSTIDDDFSTYNFKDLQANGGEYAINVALEGDEIKNDVFYVNNADSSGTITLSNVVFNEFGEWDEEKGEYTGGIAGEAGDGKEYIFRIIQGKNNLKLAFDGEIRTIQEADANMSSKDILAKGFDLYVSDTDNRGDEDYDSVRVVGWRDNLAAWAELETEKGTDKTFTIKGSDEQFLTRNATLNGENLTIKGENSNVLNLQNKKFFSQIKEDQTVSLDNIALMNSTDIDNQGTLALNDVKLQDSLTITNDNNLSISGQTNLNNTITSNSVGSLTIENAETNIKGVVKNQNITHDNSTTNLYNVDEFVNNSLILNSGAFNVVDLGLSELKLNNFVLNGGTFNIVSVDADLMAENMGRVTATEYADIMKIAETQDGTLNLDGITVVKDNKDQITTDVLFADAEIADNVRLNTNKAAGAIFNYGVSYITDKGDDKGYVRFEREDFNPEIQADSVLQLAGGYAAMLQTMEYAFEHVDRFSALPYNYKFSRLCQSVTCSAYAGVLSQYYKEVGSRSVWVKPYSTFDKMSLKNGPKVDSKIYGTLVGADSNLLPINNGWHTAVSFYLGQNYIKQSYDTVDTKLNNTIIGATQSFYKNDFYTAVTVSGGYASGDTKTSFGKDHVRMKMGGIASKSGYNVRLNGGKDIIQPTALVSYTMLDADDYTAASGVRLKSKRTDIVQLHPHVKYVHNMEDGWQPYAVAGAVFNVGKTKVTADDIELPELSIKPYAEYGVGVQRMWDEHYTAYGQVLFHSGGKNGATAAAGFRWNF